LDRPWSDGDTSIYLTICLMTSENIFVRSSTHMQTFTTVLQADTSAKVPRFRRTVSSVNLSIRCI
jgi:hypothetical protein